MKIREYDFNTYVLDGITHVCAYQIEISSGGYVQTRTDNFITLSIDMTKENRDVIAYLLDNDEWDEEDLSNWNEYDKWYDESYLTEGDAPVMITEWLDNLPEYEMLDWSEESAN